MPIVTLAPAASGRRFDGPIACRSGIFLNRRRTTSKIALRSIAGPMPRRSCLVKPQGNRIRKIGVARGSGNSFYGVTPLRMEGGAIEEFAEIFWELEHP